MSDWSARQYGIFGDERTRPVRDLLALLPEGGIAAAVDLGCGPGNSTELLAGRYPDASITGVDSAPDMIEAAVRRLPDVRFEHGTIEAWAAADGPAPDVVLSNAALQWVPDHATLLPRLLGRVAPGGHLAVQVPDNLAEPVQVAMRTVAAAGPWSSRLAAADASRTPIGTADWHYARLAPYASSVEIWRTTYLHRLAGIPAVVEWFKGTGLLPFLSPLDEAERAAFLTRYQDEIASTLHTHEDGTALLPMPRLFIVARR